MLFNRQGKQEEAAPPTRVAVPRPSSPIPQRVELAEVNGQAAVSRGGLQHAGLPSPTPTMGSDAVDHVIDSFAMLPRFNRNLLAGDQPAFRVRSDLQDKLAVLDLGAMKAVIVQVDGLSVEEQDDVRGNVRSIRGALRAAYELESTLTVTPQVMKDILRGAAQVSRRTVSSRALELFNRWVEIAVRDDATDIHVEVVGPKALVRVRIDGNLEPLSDSCSPPGTYAATDALDAIAAVYNETRKGSNNSNYEPEKFVGCMIDFDVQGASGQLRYQNLKGRAGPKAVVRILRSGETSKISLKHAG